MIGGREVDRTIFSGFERDAERLLAETSEMVRDFRTRCEGPNNEVVVT